MFESRRARHLSLSNQTHAAVSETGLALIFGPFGALRSFFLDGSSNSVADGSRLLSFGNSEAKGKSGAYEVLSGAGWHPCKKRRACSSEQLGSYENMGKDREIPWVQGFFPIADTVS